MVHVKVLQRLEADGSDMEGSSRPCAEPGRIHSRGDTDIR